VERKGGQVQKCLSGEEKNSDRGQINPKKSQVGERIRQRKTSIPMPQIPQAQKENGQRKSIINYKLKKKKQTKMVHFSLMVSKGKVTRRGSGLTTSLGKSLAEMPDAHKRLRLDEHGRGRSMSEQGENHMRKIIELMEKASKEGLRGGYTEKAGGILSVNSTEGPAPKGGGKLRKSRESLKETGERTSDKKTGEIRRQRSSMRGIAPVGRTVEQLALKNERIQCSES